MPMTMMLDGTRQGRIAAFFDRVRSRRLAGLGADAAAPAGDPWYHITQNGQPISPSGEFLASAFGFGVLTFALATAGIRGWRAVNRWAK